ncbi:hypothetical protein B0J11DRAFT_558903 [Dendryphion nanum]|uniref:Bacteriophage T5 Orf172 DNA-binding domain-containing protein n=1 Tax=Dendryphion nanum TaxID=256645 RepID=A0A9P9DV15_9PLEO|nr:hypothetical protein B0J11DRAFT_558903 [Dendryphion nanum]
MRHLPMSPPNSPPQNKLTISEALEQHEDGYQSSGHTRHSLCIPQNNPQNLSSMILNEAKIRGGKNQITASGLRSQLDLDSYRCGAPKSNGEHCRTPIHGQTKSDRPCLTFVLELGKLVKLPRIEAWDTIVRVQITKVLDGTHCRNKIVGRKVQNCGKAVDEIVRRESFSDDDNLHDLLEVLAGNIYCHLHTGDQCHQQVLLWKSSIIDIRNDIDVKPVPDIEEVKPEGPKHRTQASRNDETKSLPPNTNDHLAQKQCELPQSNRLRLVNSHLDADPATYWPEEYDNSPFEIIRRCERLSDYKSSYNLIQKEIIRVLEAKERLKGHVYMYEVEGNKGYVKIGYTTRTLKERHEEWEFDCNRKPTVLYPIPMDCAIPIPNAQRVDALCHAELHHRRTTIRCKGC